MLLTVLPFVGFDFSFLPSFGEGKHNSEGTVCRALMKQPQGRRMESLPQAAFHPVGS